MRIPPSLKPWNLEFGEIELLAAILFFPSVQENRKDKVEK